MSSVIPRGVRDNLRFLIAEVASQVVNLQDYLDTASITIAQRILDRSGYAYNLKTRIHKGALSQISSKGRKRRDPASLKAIEYIASDLERIAELCRDVIHQVRYINNIKQLRSHEYVRLLKRVEWGINHIDDAVKANDTQAALKIGRIEDYLDRAYRKQLVRYTRQLKKGKDIEDLISALLVAHTVEQMGDVLRNISEAIISLCLGQPMNTERYHSMVASIEQLNSKGKFADLTIEPIAETRSGSGISGISSAQNQEGFVAIFKDGKKGKLKEELQGVESWHEIFPGLAPKILSYKKRGQSAALLIEHLAGLTFEQILLHESEELLQQTLKQLQKTVKKVWKETRTKKPVSAGYMRQLSKRLSEVYTIHPEFRHGEKRVNGHRIDSFDRLLARCETVEAGLPAPFSVYIHGDFNLDNIIYDPLEKKINFIDLHRSSYMDYVQDISVFMVSNYRLQVLDPPLRRKIMKSAKAFYLFSGDYAQRVGDNTFDLRLALGLARSFATSTRFILDKSLARAMFLRARYLMERVLGADLERAGSFRLPIKELFIG